MAGKSVLDVHLVGDATIDRAIDDPFPRIMDSLSLSAGAEPYRLVNH